MLENPAGLHGGFDCLPMYAAQITSSVSMARRRGCISCTNLAQVFIALEDVCSFEWSSSYFSATGFHCLTSDSGIRVKNPSYLVAFEAILAELLFNRNRSIRLCRHQLWLRNHATLAFFSEFTQKTVCCAEDDQEAVQELKPSDADDARPGQIPRFNRFFDRVKKHSNFRIYANLRD